MSAVSAPKFTFSLLLVGLAAYFTMGVIQAIYGPSFPVFQQRYGVTTAGVGVIASVHFLGSAMAPPFVGLALRRFSVRAAATTGLLIMALGVTGVAFAPTWTVAVACALLGGLGFGAISASLNSAYASAGNRPVNLVNSAFGVGSMLGPPLVAALATGQAHHWPFLLVALLSLGSVVVGRVWGMPGIQPTAQPHGVARPGPLFALFALVVTLYVGLEAGFGAWAVRYLDALGVGGAALILSGFWGGLTLGRFLTGMIGGRFLPQHLVLGGALLTALCAALVGLPGLAPLGIMLAGLTLGPIFGSILAWMTRSLPATLVPFLLVAASAGGVWMPVLIGVLFARFGPQAVPLTLLVTGAALTLMILITLRAARPVQVSVSSS